MKYIFNLFRYFYIILIYSFILFFQIISGLILLLLTPFSLLKIFFLGKNDKFIIGPDDVCEQANTFKNCLKDIGYKTTVLLQKKKSFYESNPEYCWNINPIFHQIPFGYPLAKNIILPCYLILFFLKNDSFVVMWRESYFILNLDALLIKLSGKSYYRVYFGDDIRYRPIQFELDRLRISDNIPWHNYQKSTNNLDFFYKFISTKILHLLDVPIMSSLSSLTFSKDKIYPIIIHAPASNIKEKKQNEIPEILYCPSSTGDKNYNFVMDVIESIKEKVDFEFKMLSDEKNITILNELKKTDILIDQPGTFIARLSAEGLSNGCVVITNSIASYQNDRNHPPIVNYEWDTTKFSEVLTKIIESKNLRKRISSDAFNYYEENHSYSACTKKINNFILNTKINMINIPSNTKELLLKSSENSFQKIVIKYLY